MQAIVVKFLGPTNTKPSRWRAYCAAGSIIRSKGHHCDTDDNVDARMCAEELRDKLGWNRPHYTEDLIEGGLPNGDRVFVMRVREARKS